MDFWSVIPVHTQRIFSIVLTRKSAFFVAGFEARAALVISELSFGGDLSNARTKSREEMMFVIQTGTNAYVNSLLNSSSASLIMKRSEVQVLLGPPGSFSRKRWLPT